MFLSEVEYCKHILDEINYLNGKFSDLSEEEFLANEDLRLAKGSLEIIGEATKKLSKDFRTKYPDVPWKYMTGLRDKLIHDYIDIDYFVVWKILRKNIPELKPKIENLINEEEKNKLNNG